MRKATAEAGVLTKDEYVILSKDANTFAFGSHFNSLSSYCVLFIILAPFPRYRHLLLCAVPHTSWSSTVRCLGRPGCIVDLNGAYSCTHAYSYTCCYIHINAVSYPLMHTTVDTHEVSSTYRFSGLAFTKWPMSCHCSRVKELTRNSLIYIYIYICT